MVLLVGLGLLQFLPVLALFWADILLYPCLLAGGFLGGALFSLCAARLKQAPGQAYAADLTGAAMGTLLTGALLIPIIGFNLTATSTCLLTFGAALLVRERC